MKQVSYNHFTSQPSTSKKTFDVSQSTLRRWANQGIIHCARYGRRGKRLDDVAQLCEHLGVDVNRIIRDKKSRCIIYARVSSSHQKEDLQRQIQDLQSVYPGHDVISDIGSGLNFKRKGFLLLLEQIFTGTVRQVVVMHKDRLCRYGIELFSFILRKTNTKLVIHASDGESMNETNELADDLLAITTVFVARYNGRRSVANRNRRKKK